jgi:hypothetical protein
VHDIFLPGKDGQEFFFATIPLAGYFFLSNILVVGGGGGGGGGGGFYLKFELQC